MSNLGPLLRPQTPMLPTPPTGMTIARYQTYAEAQRAVDFLSDNRFPVQAVTIVGTDLRMVERVTGRLTYGRTAFAGALSGAWFGLFVGLLLTLFASGGGGFGVPAAMLIGAGFGMLFGVITFAATGGRRDFSSQSQIVASEYQVMCQEQHARAAMDVLDMLATAQTQGATGRPPVVPPGPATGSFPGASDPRPADGSETPPSASDPRTDPQAEAEDIPEQPITGPTYGEIMEQRRRERQERERRDREGAAE